MAMDILITVVISLTAVLISNLIIAYRDFSKKTCAQLSDLDLWQV